MYRLAVIERRLKCSRDMGGVPKIRCTFLGVPIIRFIVFWGLYGGPLIWRNYHIPACSDSQPADTEAGRRVLGFGVYSRIMEKKTESIIAS